MPPSSMQFLNSFFLQRASKSSPTRQCISQQWNFPTMHPSATMGQSIIDGDRREGAGACSALCMHGMHLHMHLSVASPSRAAYARSPARHTTDANLLLIQGLADVVAQIASSPRFRRIITISSRARFEPLEIAM